MSEQDDTRRQPVDESGLPSERKWERSAVLEPQPGPRVPELIGDGGGLPFSPAVFGEPSGQLDRDDPAVARLVAELVAVAAPKKQTGGGLLRRGTDRPTPGPAPSLNGWRLLARNEDEAVFGRGQPPKLLTVVFERKGRGGRWRLASQGDAKPLRAVRDGIRASSWRLDPTRELAPEDTALRILVREQTFSGSQTAAGRVLTPDLYEDEDELILTMFVKPRPGFQMRGPNPETPVRVALPHAVGSRRLIDGALYGLEEQPQEDSPAR